MGGLLPNTRCQPHHWFSSVSNDLFLPSAPTFRPLAQGSNNALLFTVFLVWGTKHGPWGPLIHVYWMKRGTNGWKLLSRQKHSLLHTSSSQSWIHVRIAFWGFRKSWDPGCLSRNSESSGLGWGPGFHIFFFFLTTPGITRAGSSPNHRTAAEVRV